MMTKNIDKENTWAKVLNEGKIPFDDKTHRPPKVYKPWQESIKQRRGVRSENGR